MVAVVGSVVTVVGSILVSVTVVSELGSVVVSVTVVGVVVVVDVSVGSTAPASEITTSFSGV